QKGLSEEDIEKIIPKINHSSIKAATQSLKQIVAEIRQQAQLKKIQTTESIASPEKENPGPILVIGVVSGVSVISALSDLMENPTNKDEKKKVSPIQKPKNEL
ncbi:4574_t:CDS:2, partial [Racocetra persica]